MSIKYDKYTPLYAYLSPASIPQIVAHIQDYLVKHPILSVETIAEIIVQSLQEHPELINGTAIPISADSEQSIKAYIDSLPSIDTYTKAEINTLLTGKQDTLTFDQAPTPGSANPVTSSGIIAAMSAMNEALETLINAKADSVSTYTKTQVDTLLTDKANTDDVYSKNTMDAKLLEYATSDSVYSKADINTMKQVNKANLAIVSSDGTAPLDIAAGQYVYFNDVMYMATEEILTGARLVPNSNIVLNPTGVTNRIGDGLKNAVTQINGLAETVSNQSQQINGLAETVSNQSQQKANQGTLAKVENGVSASKTIPANSFFYHGGELFFTDTQIPQDATIPPAGAEAVAGLNVIATLVSKGLFAKDLGFFKRNTNKTLHIPSGSTHIIMTYSAESSCNGLIIASANNAGTVGATKINTTEYNITVGTNTVTFTGTSTSSTSIFVLGYRIVGDELY